MRIRLHRIAGDGKASPLSLPTTKFAFCTVDKNETTPVAAKAWVFWQNHGWMVKQTIDQIQEIIDKAEKKRRAEKRG